MDIFNIYSNWAISFYEWFTHLALNQQVAVGLALAFAVFLFLRTLWFLKLQVEVVQIMDYYFRWMVYSPSGKPMDYDFRKVYVFSRMKPLWHVLLYFWDSRAQSLFLYPESVIIMNNYFSIRQKLEIQRLEQESKKNDDKNEKS